MRGDSVCYHLSLSYCLLEVLILPHSGQFVPVKLCLLAPDPVYYAFQGSFASVIRGESACGIPSVLGNGIGLACKANVPSREIGILQALSCPQTTTAI